MRVLITGLLLCAAAHCHAASPDLTVFDHDPHPDLRSVLVMQGGRIVAERYYNGATADTLHDVRSAGKSITALLAGTAVDRGLLDTRKPVGAYWPAAANSAVGAASLDDILTMRSGLAAFDDDPDSPGNEDKMDDAPDTVKFILSIPRAAAPGTQYRYNSLTAHVAALTIEQATGRDLEAYARTALFAPLGITHWQWGRRRTSRNCRSRIGLRSSKTIYGCSSGRKQKSCWCVRLRSNVQRVYSPK